ncbi:MAG: hypothetical protein ACI9XR_001849 [Flavobacterium sp.]|jgi:hypothetical protein
MDALLKKYLLIVRIYNLLTANLQIFSFWTQI